MALHMICYSDIMVYFLLFSEQGMIVVCLLFLFVYFGPSYYLPRHLVTSFVICSNLSLPLFSHTDLSSTLQYFASAGLLCFRHTLVDVCDMSLLLLVYHRNGSPK